MKILVLAPQPYYIDRGTPIDVDILLRALSGRGEQVDAVVYHEGRDRDYTNVTVHRIKAPRWLKNLRPGFSIKKVFADILLFFLAWRMVSRNRYDVIHAVEESVFVAMFLKVLHGIPYVYDMDSSIAQQMVEKMPFLRPAAWVLNWFETRAIRGALACAPVCHALGDLARVRGAKHCEVLHDISQIDPGTIESDGVLRRRLNLDGPVFMYVGNLERYQGIDLLLEAFAESVKRGTRADLVVAGGSEEHIARYRAKASCLGLDGTVHFIGRWPFDRLGGLLAEADVLVAPRICGINTPQKVFSYMHSGKAVLVTDLLTHTQLVDSSVCMLGEPTPSGFSRAIDELATNSRLRARLGDAGRVFVERNHVFDAHRRRVDRLYQFVEGRLTGRSAPAPGAPAENAA